MTAIFDQHGLNFQYPKNWELQQSQTEDQALEIQVASPTGAFWSLMAFSKQHDADSLMNDILESMEQQYESVEWSPAKEVVGKFNTTGYDCYFFCLDLLVSNRMRVVEAGGHKLLLIYQAENREFDKMELVFGAITHSLLAGMEPAAGLSSIH